VSVGVRFMTIDQFLAFKRKIDRYEREHPTVPKDPPMPSLVIADANPAAWAWRWWTEPACDEGWSRWYEVSVGMV
jgi:hypothetical protein